MPIRGHSVVWRDSNNKVVKQVIHDETTRLKPYFPNEQEALRKLEYGYIYTSKQIPLVFKVLVKKTAKIT
tara:strand:- start:1716 stop:1925 length:210 start_codon:yes stop_codon:yes gene_type:complete